MGPICVHGITSNNGKGIGKRLLNTQTFGWLFSGECLACDCAGWTNLYNKNGESQLD